MVASTWLKMASLKNLEFLRSMASTPYLTRLLGILRLALAHCLHQRMILKFMLLVRVAMQRVRMKPLTP